MHLKTVPDVYQRCTSDCGVPADSGTPAGTVLFNTVLIPTAIESAASATLCCVAI
mgnify:CR=1 FL=1